MSVPNNPGIRGIAWYGCICMHMGGREHSRRTIHRARARGDPSVKLLSNLLAKTMAKTCSWNRSATGALPANRCSSDDCRRRP